MKVFNIIFKPNKPYVLSTHWPWWEFILLRLPMVRIVVRAEDVQQAKEEVYKAHVPLHDKDYINIHIISCTEKPDDFDPFNEAFPKTDKMKW
jgi:hypothetical protein